MAEPSSGPLVEVLRGQVVESRHSGSVAIVDAAGRLVFGLGAVDRPTFPRSAIKAFQALPLIESGAADQFGLENRHLALACASHNGEEPHVAAVREMLARAGQSEVCLECGAQLPERVPDRSRLAQMGAPAARIHNNCSGKHAGFVCASVAMGLDPKGYVNAEHPLMARVRETMTEMTEAPHREALCGTDGCSIPTYAIPLRSLAHGFAKFATGEGLGPIRAKAAERLRAAVAAEPFYVAGTGRFCTKAMTLTGAEAFVKTGAEGVFTAALPSLGLGVAIKIDDGASRASEVVMATVLAAVLALSDDKADQIDALTRPRIHNWVGTLVGSLRPVDGVAAALAQI